MPANLHAIPKPRLCHYPWYPIIIFLLRKSGSSMLRANFSTSLYLSLDADHSAPHLTVSHRVSPPACPFYCLRFQPSMPLPPTLSVTCPTQPAGPPTPFRLSHCTLAQSISSPHLPCTLGGSRVISTLETPLPNTQTHTTPNVQPHNLCSPVFVLSKTLI